MVFRDSEYGSADDQKDPGLRLGKDCYKSSECSWRSEFTILERTRVLGSGLGQGRVTSLRNAGTCFGFFFFHYFWLFQGYKIMSFKRKKILKHHKKNGIQTDFPVTNRSRTANWHYHWAAPWSSNYPLFLSNPRKPSNSASAKSN